MGEKAESRSCERVRVGAAQTDITPDFGTHLAGEACGVHRPAQSVLDRLYVRAVVFKCGGRMLVFVTFDVKIKQEEEVCVM